LCNLNFTLLKLEICLGRKVARKMVVGSTYNRRQQNAKAEKKQFCVGIAFRCLDLCATENAMQVPLSVFILHSS